MTLCPEGMGGGDFGSGLPLPARPRLRLEEETLHDNA